jgi:hypothetical protein
MSTVGGSIVELWIWQSRIKFETLLFWDFGIYGNECIRDFHSHETTPDSETQEAGGVTYLGVEDM